MARPRVSAGGGFAAIGYVLKKGFEAGSPLELYRRLRSRNVCKTCALGMGGQRGGMVNEAGHFPEVCKKSVQAQGAAAVFVDLEVFAAAPPRMIRSGLGDSLCRSTAQADWLLAHRLLATGYRLKA